MFTALQWVYVSTAAVGGVLLLGQIVLAMFGAGHDVHVDHGGDFSHEGETSGAASWLSFRAVIAFVTFFGIGGMAASTSGASGLISSSVALLCGLVSFVVMRSVLMQFDKLRATGTVDISNAVGAEAKVYLTIPSAKQGNGAITVAIQGRTMQYRAITDGRELKTGELCKVIAAQAGDTLVVQAI